jgi:hypothetical protein
VRIGSQRRIGCTARASRSGGWQHSLVEQRITGSALTRSTWNP